MKLRLTVALSAGLISFWALAASAQNGRIGFALDVSGTWTVNGRALVEGEAVPAGGRVRFAGDPARTIGASITIVLLNNRAIHLRCDIPGTCGRDYELPLSLQAPPSFLQRLTEAALTVFGTKPEKYVPTLSRGGEGPADAVLRLTAGRLTTSPCLRTLDAGRYLVEFASLRDTPTGNDALPIEIGWTRGEPPEVRAAGLQPGLYEIRVAPLHGKGSPMTAWALVVRAARYRQAVSDYRALEHAADSWDADVPVAARRAFLRAGLDSLARTYR